MSYCTCDNRKKEHRYGNGSIRCENCGDVWNPKYDMTKEEKLEAKIFGLEAIVEGKERLLSGLAEDYEELMDKIDVLEEENKELKEDVRILRADKNRRIMKAGNTSLEQQEKNLEDNLNEFGLN